MNKFTKGAIATGAGVVLLLGGAGTFALWNDEASVNGGTVTSGVLDITAGTTGSWNDVTSGSPVAISNIGAFKVVPGDVLEFTQNVQITATGNNLEGELTVDGASITGALASKLDIDFIATGTGVTGSGTDTLTITPGATGVTNLAVKVRVTFPASTTDQVGQNETANLSGLTLLLEQV